jgi:hypothetical protein
MTAAGHGCTYSRLDFGTSRSYLAQCARHRLVWWDGARKGCLGRHARVVYTPTVCHMFPALPRMSTAQPAMVRPLFDVLHVMNNDTLTRTLREVHLHCRHVRTCLNSPVVTWWADRSKQLGP